MFTLIKCPILVNKHDDSFDPNHYKNTEIENKTNVGRVTPTRSKTDSLAPTQRLIHGVASGRQVRDDVDNTGARCIKPYLLVRPVRPGVSLLTRNRCAFVSEASNATRHCMNDVGNTGGGMYPGHILL